ncbi:MAG: nitrilase-related carbon-nitrogen hydrolase [Acidobacteriota bacterium]
MRIALAQLSSTEDRAVNLDKVIDAIDRAAAEGAELFVVPEVVLDRFFPQYRCPEGIDRRTLAEPVPGPTVDRLAAKAREHEMVIVFNLYELDEEGNTFDSSPVIDADGSLLGVTRMVHITDFPRFHEQDYYTPGNSGAPVYDTRVGQIGVAICYDRHYPEYMRALGVAGAELVVIPQAGVFGEWPEGMYEAEVRTAAFQNGYFTALCNRVGVEDDMTFAGESFISDPEGRIVARGRVLEEDLVIADLDLGAARESTARRLFYRDRRPELYAAWIRERTEGSRS